MALYFAYGSNMASARLAARVPSARPVGPARLRDFAFRCNKRGADGTAKANLAPEPGAETWGVLYELDPGAFEVLDRLEGGYERVDEFPGLRRRLLGYRVDRRGDGYIVYAR